jgi:hypothetical protein
LPGFSGRHDSYLITVGSDQPDSGRRDLFIQARLFSFSSDILFLRTQLLKRSATRHLVGKLADQIRQAETA